MALVPPAHRLADHLPHRRNWGRHAWTATPDQPPYDPTMRRKKCMLTGYKWRKNSRRKEGGEKEKKRREKQRGGLTDYWKKTVRERERTKLLERDRKGEESWEQRERGVVEERKETEEEDRGRRVAEQREGTTKKLTQGDGEQKQRRERKRTAADYTASAASAAASIATVPGTRLPPCCLSFIHSVVFFLFFACRTWITFCSKEWK